MPSLLSLFNREPDEEWPTQRRDIALLPGRIGDPRAVPPLVAALATPAVLPGTAGVLQVLLATLYDRDVRLAIVTSLGQLGHPQAIDALSRVAQTDADPSVRHSAAKALAQLGNDRSRPSNAENPDLLNESTEKGNPLVPRLRTCAQLAGRVPIAAGFLATDSMGDRLCQSA